MKYRLQPAKNNNPGDKRAVAGKSLLCEGLVLDAIAAGTHVVIPGEYKGSDCTSYTRGVVVEVLEGGRFGVHLYWLGLTTAQDRYYVGSPDNPITVDFTGKELVGVPTPKGFSLDVKLAVAV